MFYENYSGYMKYERDDFVILRPSGAKDYLFLYFPVPMHFIKDGCAVLTKKDACVLFRPGEAHHFYADTRFCNSFVHFESDTDLMKVFAIETGNFFYPESAKKINELIKKINDEALENNTHSDILIDSYISQILVLSERSFLGEECDELKKQFVKLRSTMLSTYEKDYDIDSLCASVCMSRSRFYDYYKQFFKSSPKQELLNMRMEAAQALLSNKSKTTAEIAKDVGFENVEHFTRYYKKHFGISPRRSK